MKSDAIDKRLKKEAVDYVNDNIEILLEYRDFKREIFKHTPNSALLYHNFMEKYGHKGLLGCNILRLRHYQRVKRISDRIENIVLDAVDLGNGLFFITMTFSDKYLSKTTATYRRKLVERLLRKYCLHFVANIDFGDDEKYSHREHYHAFVETNQLKALKDEYYKITKSYIHAKGYYSKKHSTKYIANYVIKLVNHSVKTTTLLNRVIFDRNKYWSYSVGLKNEHQEWVYIQEHPDKYPEIFTDSPFMDEELQ